MIIVVYRNIIFVKEGCFGCIGFFLLDQMDSIVFRQVR